MTNKQRSDFSIRVLRKIQESSERGLNAELPGDKAIALLMIKHSANAAIKCLTRADKPEETAK